MERFWKYKLDHVIFWTATVGFHMFTRVGMIGTTGFDHFVLEVIVRNGLLALLIYFNLLILIPRFVQRKKVITYAFLLLGAVAMYVLLKNSHDLYLNRYLAGAEKEQYFFSNTYYNFSIAAFYVAFSVALQLSKAWYFQKELIRKMEVDKLNAELEYLKAQINPHFVFNSINSIYFQIDKENVTARQSLSAFSDMLRYQLYECNGREILIEKEIEYLKNYVALQRMRKDENYRITLVEGGDLKGFTISPLILIPFVENAFKHVSHHPGENEVRIRMQKTDERFQLSVFNTTEAKKGPERHAGIGLKNVRRRLDLLYQDRYELKINNAPHTYEVTLSLLIA